MELKAELVKKAVEADCVIEGEALALLAEQKNAIEILEKALAEAKNRSEFVVTHALLDPFIESQQVETKALQLPVQVESKLAYDPPARSVEAKLEVSIRNDVTGKSRCTGEVSDFVKCFRDRFRKLESMLKRMDTQGKGIASINEAKGFAKGRQARLIAMVREKGITKNGNVRLLVEDEESTAQVIFTPREQRVFKSAQEVLLDEVIALDVVAWQEGVLIGRNVVMPGAILQEKKRRLIEEEVSIAFISDLHFGSRFFMKDNFEKFLKFLKGEGSEEEKKLAGSIKYLSIAGDIVDGVGVYPSQEKQLVTKDIYAQYNLFAEFAQAIPEHIEILIAPGNHDAVRTPEPQPALPKEFCPDLRAHSNMHFVGNPSTHLVHGLEFLMYHGTSLDGLIAASPALNDGYSRPEKVGVEILKRRHLNSVYGEDSIVPEESDYLVISELPDMFHFGHVHKNGDTDYNGCLVLNSGTWQEQTDFQLKMGHQPTPCLLPIYDMKSGKLTIKNFNSQE